MTRPTGAWTVRTWWLPLPGEGMPQEEDGFATTTSQHTTWEPARRAALSLTCCRGAIAVVLYDPDGDVFGHWDRFSHRARHLTEADAIRAQDIQVAYDEEREDRRGAALPADGQQ